MKGRRGEGQERKREEPRGQERTRTLVRSYIGRISKGKGSVTDWAIEV